VPDPTGFPSTYTDTYKHIWTREEPAPNDVCQVCGVQFEQRSLWTHDVNGKAVAIPAVPASSLDVARGTADPVTSQIETWLRAQFEQDLADLLVKAKEYGSSDLVVMGKAMGALVPSTAGNQAREIELAIGHYALGKVSRLFGAWEKGQNPTIDRWKDLTAYSMMARYVRANGEWA